MRISDYYVEFFKNLGVRYVFGLNGSGTILQFFDSLAQAEGIDYVCTLHEQSAGMAADAYSSMNETLGVCLATAGPGATNLSTCIAGSFYNSNPVVYIIGQAQIPLLRKNKELRHFGFHENDIEIFRPIVKYIAEVNKPEDARYELEKAVYYCLEGRPGPVVIALPDDITWLQIEPQKLRGFTPPEKTKSIKNEDIEKCAELLRNAKRPVAILGKGVKCAHCEKETIELLETISCPIALTYAMRDAIADDHWLNVGSFGIQGSRGGNFAVQNSDCILSIGTRLDPSETGQPASNFARGAKIISVDVDGAELRKYSDYNIPCALPIEMDAKDFIKKLETVLQNNEENSNKWNDWIEKIYIWKEKYPLCLKEYYSEDTLNPYVFVKELSDALTESDSVVTDASTSKNYVYQSFQFKKGQKITTWLNYACLGYSLPGAIGAAYATNERIISIMGDGALQFNIQELATVVFNHLNIKIFVFENGGFGGICHSQDNFLGGRYYGSDREHGLPMPDSSHIARAYGLPVFEIKDNTDVKKVIQKVLNTDGPAYCSVKISIDRWSSPVKFGKCPIEDLAPLLPREEFYEQMIVKPIS